MARALRGAGPARYAGTRRGNCGRIGFWKLNNSESISSLSMVTTNLHGDAGQRQHIRARSSALSSSDTGKEGLEERASESRKIHTSGTDLIAALLEAEHEALQKELSAKFEASQEKLESLSPADPLEKLLASSSPSRDP